MKGIKSKMDIEREIYQNSQRYLKVTVSTSWSKCKSKNVKTILISDYLISLKAKYNITEEEFRGLYSMVKSAIISGAISSKDIEMEDGAVQNIKGLAYNPIEKKFMVISKSKSSKKIESGKKKIEAFTEDEEEVLDEEDVQNLDKNPVKTWNRYLTGFYKSSYCARSSPSVDSPQELSKDVSVLTEKITLPIDTSQFSSSYEIMTNE
jgi:hypothetical protein